MNQPILLDSHVFIWSVFSPDRLGARARAAIEGASALHVSTATLWELAIKFRIGRFVHPPSSLVDELGELGADELPISHRHLAVLPEIEIAHGDPFDAMLLAQAHSDSLVLVTADRALLSSGYATLDARS